jgi:hypothetical protein
MNMVMEHLTVLLVFLIPKDFGAMSFDSSATVLSGWFLPGLD